MKPLSPIHAVPIFEDVQAELISLLKGLSDEEWNSPTISTAWNVKDIVAHLLDGDIRRLSLHRDRHTLPKPSHPMDNYQSLVSFLNELNNIWVKAAKRISPIMLIELIEYTTPRVIEHLKETDPDDTALFSVAWAGEETSKNWFDIAREYTEKWHHQQQIREAAGRPLLVERKWLYPLIDTLIRAVPPVYQKHADHLGKTRIGIHITGEIDDRCLLTNETGPWQLFRPEGEQADTEITIDDDTAWRIFTKNISEQEAIQLIKISGDRQTGALIAKTVSFMK